MPRPLLASGALLALAALCVVPAPGALIAATPAAREPAPDASGMPEAVAALREIVARQKALTAAAKEKADASEAEDLRPRLQGVVDDYERLLTRNPNFAAGWAAYGLFLCDPLVEDRKAALPLLLKANGLDGEIPVVKNQIGVLLAEDGRAIDALNYFLAASDLAPKEPLYHFQIGLLLSEARADFLKSRAWKPDVIDKTMLAAFARAAELAPARTDFAYRAAEAYYDLSEPRWADAYRVWTALEDRLDGRLEKQTVRLHRARVLWKQGLAGDARELVASVDASELAGQKAKLLAEFAADEAAEEAGKRAKPPAASAAKESAVAFPPPAAAPATGGK